jgi:hypothetical protein
MFCPNCGKKIPDDARFCTGCGKKFGDRPDIASVAEDAISKKTDATSDADTTSESDSAKTTKPIDAKNSTKKSVSSSAENVRSNSKSDSVSTLNPASEVTEIAVTPETEASSTAESTSSSTPAFIPAQVRPASNKRKPTVKVKGTFIAIGVLAVVFIVAVFVLANILGFSTLGQTSSTFKTGLESDDIVANGVASDNFLNSSAYTVTNYTCDDIKKVTDTVVTATVTATIENDNYTTDLVLDASFCKASNASSQDQYHFVQKSATTTPKKGIDFDKDNDLSDCRTPLNEDGKSCTVVQNKTNEMWFATDVVSTTYNYEFDGQKWSRSKNSSKNSTNNKTYAVTYNNAINGSYGAKTGDLTSFSSIAISNLDPAKGTFNIAYVISVKSNYNVNGISHSDVSGNMTATIDRKDTGSSSSTGNNVDGCTYSFEAKGSSNSGDGQATMKGYFTTSDSGEQTIKITGGKIDYSSTLYKTTTNASQNVASGTIFKKA